MMVVSMVAKKQERSCLRLTVAEGGRSPTEFVEHE